MTEKGKVPDRGEEPRIATEPPAYEPPKLIVLGTFHELTRQALKISGSSDLMNFQPSHP
jgi:hypothetical protein